MTINNQHYNNVLPTGYKLDNFEIISILGVGGFGIAYLAKDTYLDEEYVIKEYMPNSFACRDPSGTVTITSPSNADDYAWGLNAFLNEAKTLRKCKHHNIVEITRFFEANNTAYIVMPYVKGKNLSQLLQATANKTLPEQTLKAIIFPLLDGLKVAHEKNIFHRDIKLSNIYIYDEDQTPILIDFGAARFSLGSQSQSLTTILTPGYSPHEQYYRHGKQGAWTDIYAMGAVMYCLISGKKPVEAPARVMDDPLIPAVERGKGKYSESLLRAIDHALAVKESDRPQSIEQWLLELNNTNTSPEKPIDTKQTTIHKKTMFSSLPLRTWGLVGILAISVVGLATLFMLNNTSNPQTTLEKGKDGNNDPAKGKMINTAYHTEDNKSNKGIDTERLDAFFNAVEKNENEKKSRADEFLKKGREYSLKTKFNKAITAYNKSIELNPKNARVFRYKGYALYRLNNYEQAIISLERAEQLKSGNFYNILNLMKAYCSIHQYEQVTFLLDQHQKKMLEKKKLLLGDGELKKTCGKNFIEKYFAKE